MLYDRLLRPLLFRLDPERAHELALSALRRSSTRRLLAATAPLVERPVSLWGLEFRNPLGLAAGFDKNAAALPAWDALGFGFVEVGTVTRHAQAGNPRPRVFRCSAQGALINRMGFPNDGADAIAASLERWRDGPRSPRFPVGVNIGKSKITPLEEAREDYLYSFRRLGPLGDFFVVNVSSPNTPGLRELQRPAQLRPILDALREHDADKPLLLKIAPDLTDGQIEELAALALDVRLEGIVATNTTIDHSSVPLDEKGGLSGTPLRVRSTEVVARLRALTDGRVPLVGVGGVSDPASFREKTEAGAALVELYTGFVYQGPRVVSRILGAPEAESR